MTYTIGPNNESITCLVCGRTSHHPKDIEEHYCGKCCIFHDDQPMPQHPLILDPGPLNRRFRFVYFDGTKEDTIDIMASSEPWACFTLGMQTHALLPCHRDKGFYLDTTPTEVT